MWPRARWRRGRAGRPRSPRAYGGKSSRSASPLPASLPRLCGYGAHATLFRVKSVVNPLSTETVGIGLTYLDVACAARSIPSHPPRSVYQTLLARSTATPNGRASGRGRRNSVTRPFRSRPNRPLRSSVTHTAPSGATASAVSPGDGVGITNSVNWLSAKRPILPACCSRNHTAPVASTATSPSPLPRVGTSNSVIWPSPAMRASRFASGSVAQTVPRGSTATPQGTAPAERDTWRVNAPSLSRVTLAVVASANHTALSGPTASRPSLTTAVVRGNDRMLPSAAIRETARAGPSVNQTLPAASTSRPRLSRLYVCLETRVI